MTPRQRYDAFDKAQKDLIAAGEKAGKDLRCTLASMYSGNAYYLYTFKQIRDIRLVYAPPQDLGNFGGETDNWMWPRHTCDFSFLRAYVAPDGTAADYSPSNVPYEPKVWLKVSLDGFKEGDFTFVMGYPGRTYRNYALPELKSDQENMARRIKDIQDLIGFYEAAGKNDKEVEIRYAGQVKGLYNGLKNMQGKLEGFVKYDLVDQEGRPGEGAPRLDRRRSRPAEEVRRGPGRSRSLPRQAESLRRQDRAPQRRPRRLDHHVPGLQHRPRRRRDPEARQGPGTGLSGAQPAPAQAGHPAGRAGLCLRDRPGAPEVDAQTAQSRPSGHRRLASLRCRAWPPGPTPRWRPASTQMYAKTTLGDPAKRLELLGTQAGPARRGRRSLPQARRGHGAGAQGRPRGEQGHGPRRGRPQDGLSKRPSWR